MKQHSPRFLKIVTEVKNEIREIDTGNLKQWLDNQKTFQLIDVREESEWQQGRIPNAIHISKGVIERDIEKIIPNTQTEIVLYCGGGSRSALVAYNLQKMGYTNVLSLSGGFRGWKKPVT